MHAPPSSATHRHTHTHTHTHTHSDNNALHCSPPPTHPHVKSLIGEHVPSECTNYRQYCTMVEQWLNNGPTPLSLAKSPLLYDTLNMYINGCTCKHVSKTRFETSDLLTINHGESLISYEHHVQTRSLNSV
jgi:hypothetical protein